MIGGAPEDAVRANIQAETRRSSFPQQSDDKSHVSEIVNKHAAERSV